MGKRKVHLEPTGNTDWWPLGEDRRKRCLRVLRKAARVLTPGTVAKALPPLPPRLWRKMRKLRPELYPEEVGWAKVFRVPKRDWRKFVAACRVWKVAPQDALFAFCVLLTKMVEDELGRPLSDEETSHGRREEG